jgi:excisionase family DNA binding protein
MTRAAPEVAQAEGQHGAAALMTTEEVSAQLRISVRTLKRWRSQGIGPVPVRMGATWLYPRTNVDAYIKQNEGFSR